MLNTTISHYRIVEHLGGGGMGVVYKAEDTKLGRTVALKFLPPEWSRDPDARERFLREARAASALEDSRICTIHDIDETDDGQLFIAMALYEGETLKKRLQRGRLSIGQAVDIAIQMAEGLDRAHSASIIHRDIKPANLMLTERDEVVIVDFGLAKLAGDLSLTKSGWSMGTPLYMSPEQSRGDTADERTDLWSLGVVLYEMLTGRPPFVAENHTAVARAIIDDDPPPLDILRPDAPGELGEVLSKTLEKDTGRRYQSAKELLTDLRRLKNAIPETEGLTLSTPSLTSRSRQSFAPVVLAAGVVVVAVAAAVWFMQWTGVHQQADEPPPRIVVLPFENLGSPEDEYFADGITEEITSRLAAVSGLQVISRTSAMYYKGRQVPLRQIGEELAVEFALEGTVRWDRGGEGPGRVRITPQLIRVADDSHLWSDRYDRVLDEIFVVQSDISEHVIAELEVVLFDHERKHVTALPTTNMEAYQAYLVGVQYQWMSFHEKYQWLAVDAFGRAVELDPDFAVAHAALSEMHSHLYHSKHDFTTQRLEKAKSSAERALELQPDLPEGHRALGWYRYWGFHDYDGALEEFAVAADGLPSDENILSGIYYIHRRQGRWDEAVADLERWRQIDPQSYMQAFGELQTFGYRREYRRAHEAMRRAIAISPDLPDAYDDGAITYVLWDGTTDRARRLLESAPSLDSSDSRRHFLLLLDLYDRKPESVLAQLEHTSMEAFAFQMEYHPIELLKCISLAEMGEMARADLACTSAVELLEREVMARPQDHTLHIALGRAFALLGRKEEAMRAGEHGVELRPISKDAVSGPIQVIELAKIYACVGEADNALDLIGELLSIPCDLSVPLLRLDPVWDPLRDHPRFQALLEE